MAKKSLTDKIIDSNGQLENMFLCSPSSLSRLDTFAGYYLKFYTAMAGSGIGCFLYNMLAKYL